MIIKLTENERKAQIAIADVYQKFQEEVAKQCENVTYICAACPLKKDCLSIESKTDKCVCELTTQMGVITE